MWNESLKREKKKTEKEMGEVRNGKETEKHWFYSGKRTKKTIKKIVKGKETNHGSKRQDKGIRWI